MTPASTTSPSDPRRIFEVLVRHRVDHLVIGGLAVVAHGHTRTTQDVDILAALDRANLERLAAALRELRARLSGRDAHLLGIDVYDPEVLGNGANFTLETSAGGLDFFSEVPGGGPYDDLKRRSVPVDLGAGLVIRVAGFDDLIRMKLATGREEDRDDVAALTAPAEGVPRHERQEP